MSHATPRVRTIDLDHDQMLLLDGGRESRVRVLYGAAWLTEEGEADDTILHAGGERALRGRGTLVEALGPARLQVTESAAGALASSARWLVQAWRMLRRQLQRQHFGPLPARLDA